MKSFNWEQPQRQPLAGLVVVFVNTFWEVLKRSWPFLLIILLGNKPEKSDRYEIFALAFLILTVIGALFKFFYFRFYIEQEKLVIKKGWLKKEMKVIPLEKIQSVHIEQGPVHQVLNIVKLSIDTAGSQKAEATIDALNKPMAEALRELLLSEQQEVAGDMVEKAEWVEPLVRLRERDLLKLSLSANHLETFFILLAFIVSLYDNISRINDDIFSDMKSNLPGGAIYPVMILVIAVLIVVVLISTIRIFLKFYDLSIFRTAKGYRIRSGLTHLKERVVNFKKIQFVSWKANWIRMRMRIWLLEYHIAGTDELKKDMKVQVPVTDNDFIQQLANEYHVIPEREGKLNIRIHSSYVMRRFVLVGVIPSIFLIPLAYLVWETNAFLLLVYPLIVWIAARLYQKKFRLWAMDDVLFLKKGFLGEEWQLLLWYKMQSVQINRSMYQRRTGLATVIVHTAGGSITVPFISLAAANDLVNFSLYKTESTVKGWN